MSSEINIDRLTLITGSPVPVPEIGIVLTQPKLKDVGVLGEGEFYASALMLSTGIKDTLVRDDMTDEEKAFWDGKSELEILLMALGNDPMLKIRATIFLSLLLPDYNAEFTTDKIVLTRNEEDMEIDAEGYEILGRYIKKVLKIEKSDADTPDSFNPKGDRAQEIAEKIKRNRKKVADSKIGAESSGSLASFVSSFSVGMQIPITEIVEYTVYQFQENFMRFNLHTEFDIGMKARLAGATGVENTNWTKNI